MGLFVHGCQKRALDFSKLESQALAVAWLEAYTPIPGGPSSK